MILVAKYFWRFFFLILFQLVIFNHFEPGLGIQIMVYPLCVFLLPFEMPIIPLMLLSFGAGLTIDYFSDSFGLHASSLLLFGYLRPIFLKMYAPRDGYDPLKEPIIRDMGTRWFLLTFGYLMLIHHFWFFFFEIFRLGDFLFVLQKTILSVVLSFISALILQSFVVTRTKAQS
ncbi:MAG: hypothetical protein RL264_2715 [Bacteroidota bacterium]|jgi:hypothetical protein